MLRLNRLRLALGAALLLAGAGCTLAPTELPPEATIPLLTATVAPATLSPATAVSLPSASAISIQTSTPSQTPIPFDTATALPSATPTSSSTPLPTETPSETAAATDPAATEPPPDTATAPAGATAMPISILSFSVSPQEINPGQSVTLTWEATGQEATLYRLDALGRLAEFFSVPISGSLTLPTPAGQRDRVDFMLFASAGGSSASATVSAVIRCPDTWFFANPPALCPASPPNTGSMAAERFERGLMIWTGYQDRIYILYSDGGSPLWDAQPNAWFPGQPENDPGLTPPDGLFQPVRGFGAAWRTGYVSPSQVVRDRLGWATEPEQSHTGSVQCDSAPKYNRCYLSGPSNVVYVLEPERSNWKVWTGP
jgi:hypothetical protein